MKRNYTKKKGGYKKEWDGELKVISGVKFPLSLEIPPTTNGDQTKGRMPNIVEYAILTAQKPPSSPPSFYFIYIYVFHNFFLLLLKASKYFLIVKTFHMSN